MLPSLLAREIQNGLKHFLTTGFEPSDPLFAGVMQRFTQDEARWLKGPYIQVGLPFRTGTHGKTFFENFETEHPGHIHSFSHGPAPKTFNFQHLEDALASLTPLLKQSLAEGRKVCVIVPTKHDASAVQGSLKAEKLATTILGPDERDKPDSKSVRIATMHRAKGLEFDEVVLLMPRNWIEVRSGADNGQRLKYVALTRAKRVATVVQY